MTTYAKIAVHDIDIRIVHSLAVFAIARFYPDGRTIGVEFDKDARWRKEADDINRFNLKGKPSA
jgi:hypothetical protein